MNTKQRHKGGSDINMIYQYTDIGYCRIYFSNGKNLYCLQEEVKDLWYFYLCFDDEPGHQMPIPKGLEILDESDFAKSAKEYLTNYYKRPTV